MLWESILIFMVHATAVSSDQHRNELCRGNRDEFGFALVGHDYKKVLTLTMLVAVFSCVALTKGAKARRSSGTLRNAK